MARIAVALLCLPVVIAAGCSREPAAHPLINQWEVKKFSRSAYPDLNVGWVEAVVTVADFTYYDDGDYVYEGKVDLISSNTRTKYPMTFRDAGSWTLEEDNVTVTHVRSELRFDEEWPGRNGFVAERADQAEEIKLLREAIRDSEERQEGFTLLIHTRRPLVLEDPRDGARMPFRPPVRRTVL